MDWNEAQFGVGVDYIDEQHQMLFQYVNEIDELAEKSNLTVEELKRAFQKVKDYARRHFRDEEQILEQHNYKDLERHRQIHRDLEKQVDELESRLDKVGLTILPVIQSFLTQWLITHIAGTDRKYAPLVERQAVPRADAQDES